MCERYGPPEVVQIRDVPTPVPADEGWLLSVVYNAIEDSSELVILDARNFDGEPVARIALPQPDPVRVPRHLAARIHLVRRFLRTRP